VAAVGKTEELLRASPTFLRARNALYLERRALAPPRRARRGGRLPDCIAPNLYYPNLNPTPWVLQTWTSRPRPSTRKGDTAAATAREGEARGELTVAIAKQVP